MSTIRDSTAARFFGTRSADYDEHARLGMPRRDEMLTQLVERLPVTAGQVLQLGCGTGALTAELVRRYPAGRVRATDGAPEMLERARARVRGLRGADVDFGSALFEELEIEPESFDLITSCMALHHVVDKGPFYAGLRRGLRPGGLLIFADELRAALEHVERLHWNAWLAFARQPGHLSDAELDDALEHIDEHDHYETLWDQLRLLHAAGFRDVDCVWRYLNYGVFTARA
jgi:tRNA (cmo5U34)-methyltransferase